MKPRKPLPRTRAKPRSTARAELDAGLRKLKPSPVLMAAARDFAARMNGSIDIDEAARVSRERAARKKKPQRERDARPGDLVSPSLRAWVKTQRCQLGTCQQLATELHHVPTRGALGVAVDLLGAAVCRACHRHAHLGYADTAEQQLAAHRTLALAARRGVLDAFLREMVDAT